MRKSGSVKLISKTALAVLLIGLGVICVGARVPDYLSADGAALMAAAVTVSKGSYDTAVPETTAPASTQAVSATEAPSTQPVTSSDFSSAYYNTFANHKGAKKLPVYTKQYLSGGKKYQNFYVKNNTSFPLDIGTALTSELGFKMDKGTEVQVLIYHTHTSESYLDCDVGYYFSDYYPRTADKRYNVTQVGEAIANELRAAGIGVIHDTTSHDNTYNGSYLRSRATINSYLEKYPDIKVTLDIHRDSIGSESYKVKPTFTYKGKKGAQIMIMSGYDPAGELNFPNWKYNLRFALRLQQQCETSYSGMTRPLNFGNFAYNMNVNTGSLLVEFGTDANTLDEATYSGKLFGKALAGVLQNNV